MHIPIIGAKRDLAPALKKKRISRPVLYRELCVRRFRELSQATEFEGGLPLHAVRRSMARDWARRELRRIRSLKTED